MESAAPTPGAISARLALSVRLLGDLYSSWPKITSDSPRPVLFCDGFASRHGRIRLSQHFPIASGSRQGGYVFIGDQASAHHVTLTPRCLSSNRTKTLGRLRRARGRRRGVSAPCLGVMATACSRDRRSIFPRYLARALFDSLEVPCDCTAPLVSISDSRPACGARLDRPGTEGLRWCVSWEQWRRTRPPIRSSSFSA